jgi:hypothetical protein
VSAAREHARAESARLPDRLRMLDEAEPYLVEISADVSALASRLDAQA